MKKIILILPLLLVLAGCGGPAVTSVEKSGNAAATAVDIATTTNLSDKCDKQAQAIFTLGGFDKQGATMKNHLQGDKCYVLITNKIANQTIKTLSEAFGGQSMGSFSSGLDPIAGPNGKPLLVCLMGDKSCTSEAEFDAFVKTYMEE